MTRIRITQAKQRNALVAGGAGFLGSHLCDALIQAGWRVYCVDNLLTSTGDNIAHLQGHGRFEFIEADICEPLALRTRMHRVYNLACAASPPRYQADPIHTMMTSVLGTRNLLDIAARDGARFLQASTSEVYGDPEEHPQREAYWGNVNPTGPRACYDEGKRAAEALCFDNMRLERVDVRVARIFNTYGPRMHPEDGRIVSNFVMQALRKTPLTIYGSGEQTRSFCYVSDLVTGLMALSDTQKNPRTPINLGNPVEFTMRELADSVLAITGSSAGAVFRPLPTDDPRRRRPDISLAQAQLDWRPKTTLAEGLPPTVAWFREQLVRAGQPITPRSRAKAMDVGKESAAP